MRHFPTHHFKWFGSWIELPIPILLVTCLTNCTSPKPDHSDLIWFDRPAQEWTEALPVGNGRIGAMVFGRTDTERIQLNDDSLWPADEGWDHPPGTPEDLQKIRELLFEGRNSEADAMFVDRFSNKSILRSHQTLGDLFIDLGHDDITDYRRELDLTKGVVTVSYRIAGDLVTEKVWASQPHQAILVEISTTSPDGLDGKIRLDRPMDQEIPTVKVSSPGPGRLLMKGEVTQRNARFRSQPAPIENGVEFETLLEVRNEGGSIYSNEDHLVLDGVETAELRIVSNSSWYVGNIDQQNQLNLDRLKELDLGTIESEHIADHRSIYDRVDFCLMGHELDSIPTDQRLERVKNAGTDPGLQELLFKYGRYLLIASSREGTNPANLQGLWNEHISAPWNADYHLNINLQMNYWPANLTGMDELNMPLFDYIDRLVESGKVTAKQNYGCNGSFIPHATDLWAPTWLRAATAYWGCSLGAGGWLMQHYWQHFEFTSDTTFLMDRAYPAIRKVATFYSDWLIEDPRDGYLISAPSTSPENSFVDNTGESVATCLGSAMDQQVIYETFSNFLNGSEILEISDSLVTKIKSQIERLRPGFVLGSDGRILEWDREYEEPEPGHRHMSHLYGFHPGDQVNLRKTPGLVDAVRKTLEYRLENGGAGTGWSRAWLINCSARLNDGKMASEHIKLFMERSLYPNLFDAHPPFQIDGNFGFTAGIAEMLVQSHEDGLVRLLPALSTEWENGYVKGLKARGGITVSLEWENGRLTRAELISDLDQKIEIAIGQDIFPVDMTAGKEVTIYPPE